MQFAVTVVVQPAYDEVEGAVEGETTVETIVNPANSAGSVSARAAL